MLTSLSRRFFVVFFSCCLDAWRGIGSVHSQTSQVLIIYFYNYYSGFYTCLCFIFLYIVLYFIVSYTFSVVYSYICPRVSGIRVVMRLGLVSGRLLHNALCLLVFWLDDAVMSYWCE